MSSLYVPSTKQNRKFSLFLVSFLAELGSKYSGLFANVYTPAFSDVNQGIMPQDHHDKHFVLTEYKFRTFDEITSSFGC